MRAFASYEDELRKVHDIRYSFMTPSCGKSAERKDAAREISAAIIAAEIDEYAVEKKSG